MIEARGVSKTFSRPTGLLGDKVSTVALNDVSVMALEREILGIVGESGSGKSTLGRALVGLVRPDRGEIFCEGERVFADGKALRRSNGWGVQIVFQDPYSSLNPRMKVGEIVAEGLNIKNVMKREERRIHARSLLSAVGLPADAGDMFPHQFSGGQRQRISIARALALEPKVLVADEAVSALDVSVQMQILNLLLDLRDRLGLCIVFISHDLSVIDYLCDRVLVMYRGEIVEQGRTAQVIDRPEHAYTRRLIEARPR